LLLPSLFPALYHYNLLEKISETSPVKVRTLSLHLSAIYTPCDYCSYWTSTSFAVLSSHVASYMISVRQTRGLPKASFRFHITMDTLAIGYALTATRSRSGLTPVRVRPCWANKKAVGITVPQPFYKYFSISRHIISLFSPVSAENGMIVTFS